MKIQSISERLTDPDVAFHLIDSCSPPELVIIRGLPGTGKSTLAKQFAPFGYRHVEADMYFYSLGKYRFSKTLIPQAQKWSLDATRFLLLNGSKVVVSNLFLKIAHLKPYLSLGRSHIIIQLIEVHSNSHSIDAMTLKRMKNSWEAI